MEIRIFSLLFFALTVAASAADLHVEIGFRFGGKPLLADSLRYETSAGEAFSVSRCSLLLGSFALRETDGSWVEVPDQFAYLDLASRRTRFSLKDIPENSYEALRFTVGLDEKVNHRDPAQYTAAHPLNPNLNRLHWTWQDGYIFMALEGRYRKKGGTLGGYVYHFANDDNRTEIELSFPKSIKGDARGRLAFDLQPLFNGARPITFTASGDSTHSHKGDPIAAALRTNLATPFSIVSLEGESSIVPAQKVAPLYLPAESKGYRFKMAGTFPRPPLPLDNPLLNGRVALGEQLFNDASLSQNGQISCASCHQKEFAFSDPRQFSMGVNGKSGSFHSMPLFNLAWKSSFFWDGRAKSLREQVLEPLQDPNEMGSTLEDVVTTVEQKYPDELDAAFGSPDASSEKVGLALESYLLTLTSYDSKFDRAMKGEATLEEDERRGFELFFTEYEPRSRKYGADCFHCHGGALFSDHGFHDNGLAPGGKRFATPSLRNLGLTAPYMHDGRFGTLEEVVEHYNSEIHPSETLDPNLAKHPAGGLGLSAEDKAALVAFLKTLDDPKFLE